MPRESHVRFGGRAGETYRSKGEKAFRSDLTRNVRTGTGFLYLAVVLDAWSRRVVGWSMASHLRTELVLDALNMANWQRRPRGVVHHSDQGPTPSFSAASRSAGWSPPEPASLRPATVFVTGARYAERPPQVDEPTARVESDSVR